MKRYILTIIINLVFGSLFANTLSLTDNGSGTWNVNYSSNSAIGGFQFTVDGTTINSASGGVATSSGFMTSASGSMVLGFSLTGGVIPAGDDVLLVLDLAGEPTGLSSLIISDATGGSLDFVYDSGSGSDDESITDGCDLPDFNIFLGENGEVFYNSSEAIGGFQFTVDGATVSGASGGDAQSAGFAVSPGGSTVLGFSFSGATFGPGCGTVTNLSLDGDATGLSGLIFSDSGGQPLSFFYYDGGNSTPTCNDESACNDGDEADCTYAEENFDCDGNCIVDIDCTGECGGSAYEVTLCEDTDGDGLGNPGSETTECVAGGRDVANGCDLPLDNILLNSDGSVVYNASSNIGGFQFNIDGATINSASGGDAAGAGFALQGAGSTVIGFSFSGATFGPCGTMLNLDLSGEATGFSSITISDAIGSAIPFTYYVAADMVADCSDEYPDCFDNYYDCNDNCGGPSMTDDCGECITSTNPAIWNQSCSGCQDETACNYDENNIISTEEYCSYLDQVTQPTEYALCLYNFGCDFAEVNFDCEGNSIDICDDESACNNGEEGDCIYVDCAGECGGSAEDLGCGCNLPSPSGCDEECGSTLVNDECGVCGGDGSSCSGNSYYSVDLEATGNSQLTIFSNSITGLEVGDEIGIFDANGLTNYGDCSDQYGELLVGSAIWTGEQLNPVSIGSVDLCSFGGTQLAGYVEGNPVVVKVWRSSEEMEYGADLTWGTGSGLFGDIIQSVSEISLSDPNACEDDDAAVAAFGGCAAAVAALGCDFVFAGVPVYESCPVTCDSCPDVPVLGCMDLNACNYNLEATDDDGSCEYAADNFDCYGNCLIEVDCAGECGGSAEDLGCGCGESGPSGCDNACGSTLVDDECGVCGGDGSDDLGCGCFEAGPSGCDNACGSTLVDDACGVCGGDGSDDLGCGCFEPGPNDCGDCGNDSDCYQLNQGANLISFTDIPLEPSIESIFSSVTDDVYAILGQGVSSVPVDGNWIGALQEASCTSGYWVIMNEENTLSVSNSGSCSGSQLYNISYGANLVSYPFYNSQSITDALPEQLQGGLYGIISEYSAAYLQENGTWIGSLTNFNSQKGYWFISSDDFDFTYNSPIGEEYYANGLARRANEDLFNSNERDTKELFTSFGIELSSVSSFYFLEEGIINNRSISSNDLLIARCNGEIVGAKHWSGRYSDIPVMGVDGRNETVNYCEIGDNVEFYIMDENGQEYRLNGEVETFNPNSIQVLNTLSTSEFADIPSKFSLVKAYPNPFNPSITVSFGIDQNQNIDIAIYNINGQQVDKIQSGILSAGFHSFVWNGNNVESGLYFIEILGNNQLLSSQKVALVK